MSRTTAKRCGSWDHAPSAQKAGNSSASWPTVTGTASTPGNRCHSSMSPTWTTSPGHQLTDSPQLEMRRALHRGLAQGRQADGEHPKLGVVHDHPDPHTGFRQVCLLRGQPGRANPSWTRCSWCTTRARGDCTSASSPKERLKAGGSCGGRGQQTSARKREEVH